MLHISCSILPPSSQSNTERCILHTTHTYVWCVHHGRGRYHMAENFRRKIFPQIAENMSFGGIYFAVKPVLAIMIFITTWLIERVGNLTRPWASFGSVRTKLRMKCNWKPDKSLLHLIWTVFVASFFTATAYPLFESPSSCYQSYQSQLFSHL